jgi:hypothetical protein
LSLIELENDRAVWLSPAGKYKMEENGYTWETFLLKNLQEIFLAYLSSPVGTLL